MNAARATVPTPTRQQPRGNLFYKQATERLIQARLNVLRVDCNQQAAHHAAAHILDRLTTFFAPPKEQE